MLTSDVLSCSTKHVPLVTQRKEKVEKSVKKLTIDLGRDVSFDMSPTSSPEKTLGTQLFETTFVIRDDKEKEGKAGSTKSSIVKLRTAEKKLLDEIQIMQKRLALKKDGHATKMSETESQMKASNDKMEKLKKREEELKSKRPTMQGWIEDCLVEIGDVGFESELKRKFYLKFIGVDKNLKCTSEVYCKEFHKAKEGVCYAIHPEPAKPATPPAPVPITQVEVQPS